MNGSRRNSGSSLVSSSSASSNLSHLEEDSWILWGRIVNEWEEVRKKKEKQLKVRLVHMTTCEVTAESRAHLLKSLLKQDCIKSLLRHIWPKDEVNAIMSLSFYDFFRIFYVFPFDENKEKDRSSNDAVSGWQ